MTNQLELAQLDPDALRLLEAYKKGQHGALLQEVDNLSKAGSVTPGVLGVAAMACTALERYDEAIKAATAALAQQSGWAWLYHALAAAEAGQGHLDRAVAAQGRAVRLMPREPSYAAALAQYLRRSGQLQQAVAVARQALVGDPTHGGALNEYGLALLESGSAGPALEQFRLAQSAEPAEPAGYINEGVLHLRAEARGEARRSFGQALRCRPGMSEAEDYIADTFVGQRGLLRATLGHLLALGRVNLLGWVMIAFVYYLAFRLLQFLWRAWPVLLPAAQVLLVITLVWLLGGLALGRLIRVAFAAVAR